VCKNREKPFSRQIIGKIKRNPAKELTHLKFRKKEQELVFCILIVLLVTKEFRNS